MGVRQGHGEDAAARAGEGMGDVVILRDGGLRHGCDGGELLRRERRKLGRL